MHGKAIKFVYFYISFFSLLLPSVSHAALPSIAIGAGREFGTLTSNTYPLSLQGNFNQVSISWPLYTYHSFDLNGDLFHTILESRIAALDSNDMQSSYRLAKTHNRFGARLQIAKTSTQQTHALYLLIGLINGSMSYQQTGQYQQNSYRIDMQRVRYAPLVGLGNAVTLLPHVSLRFEYQYAPFPTSKPYCTQGPCPTIGTIQPQSSMFSMHLVYHLGPSQAISHPSHSHPDGFYIGSSLGLDHGSTLTRQYHSQNDALLNFNQLYTSDGFATRGLQAGLISGYRFHLLTLIQGALEWSGHLSTSSARASDPALADITAPHNMAIVFRPALWLNQNNLLSMHIGPRIQWVKLRRGSQSQSTSNLGTQFGFGLETYLTNNLSLRGDYSYVHFGGHMSDQTLGQLRAPLKYDGFEIGLFYHLNEKSL